ncbi:MAG: tetratricopeptide repeat protein [Saprospirales bacterium]|nr:tetratricopeptide repeat protein [Saprospirales bacterium]MBK8921889.1 tetratricopeptide repeat protein [Saprospirales bacterium]
MNEQYIDTIHRFLNGAMAPDERAAFEAAMANDPALRHDVELERALLAGLEYAGRQGKRQTIRAVHQKLREEGFFDRNSAGSSPMFFQLSTTGIKRLVAAAAVFIALAASIWFFLNRNTPPDAGVLFAQYYQAGDEVLRARRIIGSLESHGMAGVQTAPDTLRMALEQYEAGNYEKALAALKNFLETHPQNDTAQYYTGVVHMSQGRYARAIDLFLPIARSAESPMKGDALWNLGLCYLKMENGLPDARHAFARLAADNNYPNHRGAKAVLEQLIPD